MGIISEPTATSSQSAAPLPDRQSESHDAAAAFAAIFKAYDVRGLCPGQFDATMAKAIGASFARFAGSDKIVVARDMRPTGIELAAAFAAGANSEGVSVIDIGLASTDLLYYASGHLGLPGATFTASHNPAQYNGIKMCLEGAKPIGDDTGLQIIRDVAAGLTNGSIAWSTKTGTVTEMSLLDGFVEHCLSFIDVKKISRFNIVADTANGMGGLVVPAVFDRLGVEYEVMYAELDGTFPNHPADPIQPENVRDLQARVVATGADVGLAFDGDADRVFLIDEKGHSMSGSLTTAMVAASILEKNPGSRIVHNLICSKTVSEGVSERGGEPIRTRVGHSFIKAVMAETDAVFGGEHSGHYYFRENWRADSGLIAALHVLELMSNQQQPLSQLRKPFERYVGSGEINTKVDSPKAVIERVEAAYLGKGAVIDHLDGLTVDFGSWWFNLRPSNTEPLLRLNLEAANQVDCEARVAEVLTLVTGLATVKE